MNPIGKHAKSTVDEIYLKEKKIGLDPQNPTIKYDAAKLYIKKKKYIPALSLLQSVQKNLEKTPNKKLSSKKISKKIKQCNKKITKEAEILDSRISEIPALRQLIKKFSKATITPKSLEVVGKNKGLLPVEVSLLQAYSSKLYPFTNKYLRGNSKLEKHLKKQGLQEKNITKIVSLMKKIVPIITHTLTKMSSALPIDKNSTVYRGMLVSSKVIEEMKKEKKFTSPGFTSTSTDIEIGKECAEAFQGITKKERLLLIIEDKKGSGIPISEISLEEPEKEVLFRPHTDFFIKEIKKTDSIWVVKATT